MASKSAQQEPEKAEVIEEALDTVDTALDRVKVLYEQFFLGIQKQPPQHLHADVERKLRDLAQLQIRNTALRYRFATLQQKFGSYNTYWRRTLREIEAGKYHRSLSRVTRHAAATGAEIPHEILTTMPKRMRDQVRRDREAQLALQRRRETDSVVDESELLTLAPLEDEDGAGFVHEPTDVRRAALRAHSGAYVLDDSVSDSDIDAYFRSVEAGGEATELPPPPVTRGGDSPAVAPPAADVRYPAFISVRSPRWLPPGPERPAAAPPASPRPPPVPPEPAGEGGSAPPDAARRDTRASAPASQLAAVSATVRAASIGATVRASSPSLTASRASANRLPTEPPVPPAPGARGRASWPSGLIDTQPGIGTFPASVAHRPPDQAAAEPPAAAASAPASVERPPTGQPAIERPTSRQSSTSMPVVPPPPKLPPIAPSQQVKPNPIAPGSSSARPPAPVESMAGPFPREAPPRPVPGGRPPGAKPPPGMTEADVDSLYEKYIKAKQMVGEATGPSSFGKLMKTINAQAPKIMEQYRAKGVDFSVVVKDNQVIIRAKPKM